MHKDSSIYSPSHRLASGRSTPKVACGKDMVSMCGDRLFTEYVQSIYGASTDHGMVCRRLQGQSKWCLTETCLSVWTGGLGK